MDKQHIILEYHKYKQKYSEKYGENTIILMQLGSFYELCAVLENDTKYGELNIYHICDNILNIAIAKKKNKISKMSIPSDDEIHYLQAGFPLISKDKFVPILLKHNYTIVIVDQVTEPPNPEREVVEILSPGTCIQNTMCKNNYLMSIYIEKYIYKHKNAFLLGISTIDLSTGKNYYHNIEYNEDPNFWFDEISRLLNFYEPSEIIIQTENYELTKDMVINDWDIDHDSIQINHFKDLIYKKPSYQNEYLSRIFNIDYQIQPLDYLDMTHKPEVALSYIYMLVYVKEHKIDILNNIEQPEEYKQFNHLALNSNSIRQLNIINNYSYYKGKHESLYEICNKCETSMGKRLLKDRLLYPLIDKDSIKLRYEKIDICINDNFYIDIKNNLKHVSDLEKMLRLMGLNLLQPYDIFSANLSYEYVSKILYLIKEHIIYKYYENYEQDIHEYYKFIDTLIKTFNFSIISNIPIQQSLRSVFNIGIFSDIDSIDLKIKTNIEYLELFCKHLSKIIDSKNDSCIKYCKDKTDQWCLFCTNKRSETFIKNLKNLGNKPIHIKDDHNDIKYKIDKKSFTYRKNDKSNTIIECVEIKQISKHLNSLYKELSKLNTTYYEETIIKLYETYHKPLKQIHHLISDIDFCSMGAKLSIDNNYCKPTIIESDKSYVNVKGIRHPIVEKINCDTEYVTNDIILGNKTDGILLFGTNACGKSTFMKAMGLNIVLAQSGLYVAADSFEYTPYKQIFTRILNNDNIFRSQSSFAVEIEELRGILKRACSNSLILGDELCSGTETKSALSIVSTGLYELSQRKSSFIFTSHLHQLNDIDVVKNLDNLDIYHLKIKYENDKLIYDRKLTLGSGPSVYGLKVCEALGLSNEFISMARQIQLSLDGENDKVKLSPYNKDLIVDICKICGNMAEETHHINEQKDADINGNIKHFHKNNKHNLVPLCKKCHDQTTYGNLIIDGYVQTSIGIELNYHYTNKVKKSKKKYGDDQIEIINKYKTDYKNNVNNCIKLLELKENIKISKNILKKIMDNEY
tara:strand:- start:462 stop:3548 length:3087 start_codon:yes stop_codon:yes gene_type:complete